MKYVAELNKEELTKFVANFLELEASRHTTITAVPKADDVDQKIVTLKSSNSLATYLLDNSFASGMMRHWGWDRKFKKMA